MPKKPVNKSLTPRVWIELEKPASKAEAERNCALANNMLKRLAEKPEDMQSRFFWSEHDVRYCYGSQMGYRVLADNGEWFNLEYLGRDLA